jgi:ribosomal protein L34E
MTTPRAAPALENVTTTKKQAVRDVTGVASSTCPRCAVMFVCGANAASCWCETLAVLDIKRRPEDLLGKGCLCEACLRAVISESANGAASDSASKASAD